MAHTLINKTHFGVRALLRLKTDNILTSLGWVMINSIRAVPHVFLNDFGANLNEGTESLREGVCNTLEKSLLTKYERYIGFIKDSPHLNW